MKGLQSGAVSTAIPIDGIRIQICFSWEIPTLRTFVPFHSFPCCMPLGGSSPGQATSAGTVSAGDWWKKRDEQEKAEEGTGQGSHGSITISFCAVLEFGAGSLGAVAHLGHLALVISCLGFSWDHTALELAPLLSPWPAEHFYTQFSEPVFPRDHNILDEWTLLWSLLDLQLLDLDYLFQLIVWQWQEPLRKENKNIIEVTFWLFIYFILLFKITCLNWCLSHN